MTAVIVSPRTLRTRHPPSSAPGLPRPSRLDDFRSLQHHPSLLVVPEAHADKRVTEPLHQFLPVTRFDEVDLGYETTEFSPKTYFLPYRENLSQFSYADHDWKQEIKYRIQPRAIVGMHACDINGQTGK